MREGSEPCRGRETDCRVITPTGIHPRMHHPAPAPGSIAIQRPALAVPMIAVERTNHLLNCEVFCVIIR